MATASHTRSSPYGCTRALLCPCFSNGQPNDAALIEPPRRIPLSDSAQHAQKKLQLACVCSVFFMVAEVVGGFLAGSLAIMADAAHLLSDVAAFCISLFAIWTSTRPPTNRLSFGFQRTEVIGAVTSVLVLWALTGVLVYAVVNRFIECLEPNPPEHVDGKLMFIVACIGLLVNLVLMQILGHGHSHGGGAHGHSHNGVGSHGHSHGGGHTHVHGHTDQERGFVDTHSGVDIQGHSHGGELLDDDHEDHHRYSENEGIYHRLSPRKHGHTHRERNSHGHGHEQRKHSFGGDLEVAQLDGAEKPTTKMNMENLNIRSAYIHALGDFIQSIGVCIAGGLIWLKPEWQIANPIATFIFSALVLFTTVGIVRDSLHILMEGSPEGINTEDIEFGLRACSSVVGAHDLHIWSLSAGLSSLSVHIVADDVEVALHATQRYLLSKGITHSTIQTEKTSSLYPHNCASDLKCGQVLVAAAQTLG
ncbi:Cation Diffusion Facilitator (CDF) Family [Phytophthora nicotianae]|uniref:Cation Diffusion Facilitator (CDF) Family n=1 Tax=Phytophthora nicotianae TaxID=4792 RepID=A0A0W8CA88_PHYNI|nr:Cation Diffusion Facilitator (CDF) Family [Phytophthora nicotianae]